MVAAEDEHQTEVGETLRNQHRGGMDCQVVQAKAKPKGQLLSAGYEERFVLKAGIIIR